MKQIANVWFKARDLSLWLLIAAGLVLPTSHRAAAYSAVDGPDHQSIQHRVEAVRRQLRANVSRSVRTDSMPNAEKGESAEPKRNDLTQWPNWPKWNNWNNWGNYWRNW